MRVFIETRQDQGISVFCQTAFLSTDIMRIFERASIHYKKII
jgi:hypothetical protein